MTPFEIGLSAVGLFIITAVVTAPAWMLWWWIQS